MSNKTKEIKISTILYAAVVLAVIFLLGVAIMLYGFGSENRLIGKTLQFLPYPAAFVGATHYISVSELEADLLAVKRFYENQDFSSLGYRVDFSTEDGRKRLKSKEKKLLNKLIENKIIERLAKNKGIIIDSKLISREVDSKIEQYGTREDVIKNLERLYGWNITEFKEKIVKPEIYKENLEKYIRENDEGRKVSEARAEKALAELKDGNDFSAVAGKYSDGESAKSGGELGWFSADQMIPEIALAAAILKEGETSDVLESSLGYHIINVQDKKTENNKEMLKISQIFVKAQNFSDWLLEQEKSIKIYVPLKDFYWDKESQSVRFRSQDMEEFEKKLEENSAGDISVMF